MPELFEQEEVFSRNNAQSNGKRHASLSAGPAAQIQSAERSGKVLIIGAGIGGLAAGLALRLRGWNVRIYERVRSVRELGFGLLLAPLWGLGQRLFFLHNGRANDLKTAILAHRSNSSEANAVINAFVSLSAQQQQDLLNFLRSL